MGNKTYLPINVLEATKDRLRLIFDRFETIVVSFSAGKDSTVLLHLAEQEARRRGRKIHALFIDLEAQYQATIDCVERLMLGNETIIPIWVCLPLNLRNAVSVFQPHWCCWEPGQTWVRPMPQHDCVLSDPAQMPFFRERMEFEEFVVEFPKWFVGKETSYASLVAIRSDESLNRWRAVRKKEGGKKSAWQHQGEEVRWSSVLHPKWENIVSFFPIYDWRFDDVWKYLGENQIEYNKIYDLMYWAGMPYGEMRICQPYGDDQRKGLDLWAKAEPETWSNVLDRVVGVNFGAKYARQKMLGYKRGLDVPAGHTWKSYTFFLLSTLPDVMRERYLSNFAVFLEWWMRHGFENLETVYDDETEPLKASPRRKLPSWRRLALAILKNDFWCKSLTVGAIKNVYADVYDRLDNGQPVKVRKSVKPVYDYLREQYALYTENGVEAVELDWQLPEHPLKTKYKDI